MPSYIFMQCIKLQGWLSLDPWTVKPFNWGSLW